MSQRSHWTLELELVKKRGKKRQHIESEPEGDIEEINEDVGPLENDVEEVDMDTGDDEVSTAAIANGFIQRLT